MNLIFASFSYFNLVLALYFSYILGSSEKQIVSEDKELFNLESRVEMEKSLKQVILFCTLYIFVWIASHVHTNKGSLVNKGSSTNTPHNGICFDLNTFMENTFHGY